MFGLVVIVINFAYLIFAIVVSTFIYKFLKKKDIFGKYKRIIFSVFITIIIFLAPQWDLLIQKGIKTYYENFKMIEEIYAYPEFDEDGRIESLGVERFIALKSISMVDTSYKPNELVKKYTKKDKWSYKMITKLQYIQNLYNVTSFIDIYVSGSLIRTIDKNGKEIIKNKYKPDQIGYAKVYLNTAKVKYEKISGVKDFTARYQVFAKTIKYYFHTERIVEFWDKKKNILMAKAIEVNFPVENDKEKFRYKYLINYGANGIGVSIRRIRNHHLIFKKLFRFTIHTSKI